MDMPNLTTTTEAMRIDHALQIWGLLEADPTLTQKDACDQIGMSVQAYRRWITEAEPVLDEFRTAIMGIRRMELQRIMAAREAVLTQVIKDGLATFTDPATRLEIHKYIVQHGDDLLDMVHAKDSSKADFLSGPELVEAESRFGEHEIEVNLKIKKPNIIDGEFQEGE
jgi:hypothetical protein